MVSCIPSCTILSSDTYYRNCPQCKVPRRATKRLTISRLPRILIIHLKRFSFKGPFSDKIDTDVQFPIYGLDLSAFVPQTQSTATDKLYSNGSTPSSSTAGTTYDLYGILQHFGTLSSGHCESEAALHVLRSFTRHTDTAIVRSRNQWWHIGDSRLQQCDESDVRKVSRAYSVSAHFA